MTSIDLALNEPLPDPAAARARMEFTKQPPRAGVEIEYHMQDLRRGGVPAADARVLELKSALRGRGIMVDDEIAAHMIEVKTEAYEIEDGHKLIRDIGIIKRAVAEEAEKLGLRPVPTANMAGLTKGRALRNLISPTPQQPERGVRARTLMAAIRHQGLDHLIPYPLLNVSAQVSVTAKNPAHLYAMAERHYKLLPFLMAALHNRAPEFDEKGVKKDSHSGIAQRRALARQGLIPAAFIRSVHAEDYIAKTLETAYDRHMPCYIDINGDFNAAAKGETVTMRTLRDKGLATRSNAQLAQSMEWTSVRMKTVPGTRMMRAEMRDIDAGENNAEVIAAINMLMNMDDECGRAVDSLLAGYGYAGAPVCYADMLARDIKRVEQNGRAGIDMRYGHGFMQNFAREFVATLDRHARKYGLQDALAPLAAIAETGITAARRMDETLPTPGAVRRNQREYGNNPGPS